MKTHTCPNCGHVSAIEPQQARAGRALWANMTPEQRSAEMSRRRRKGIENPSGKITIKLPA